MLERARVEVNKLFDDTSGALENFHSIPGWQSIDLAELVAELVEERIANGNTEFSQAKAWDGNNEDYAFFVAIDALMFWLEGNSGNFDDIREWMDGFSREIDCPGTLEFEARGNPDDNHLQ
jgi:hypothetical protein